MATGVEDDAAGEGVPEFVAEPGEVAGALGGGCGCGLDFGGDEASAAEVDDEVDLLSAGFGAQVFGVPA